MYMYMHHACILVDSRSLKIKYMYMHVLVVCKLNNNIHKYLKA